MDINACVLHDVKRKTFHQGFINGEILRAYIVVRGV